MGLVNFGYESDSGGIMGNRGAAITATRIYVDRLVKLRRMRGFHQGFGSGGGSNAKYALYDGSVSAPGNFVAETSVVWVPFAGNLWYWFTPTTTPALSKGYYWIASRGQENLETYRYNLGGKGAYFLTSWGSWPDPLVPTGYWDAGLNEAKYIECEIFTGPLPLHLP